MADLLSAIGQGLGAVGGPLVSGGLNLVGGLLQQGGQQASIQGQEQFQQNMADTQYQRSVASMTAAGLNPAMMYGSGGSVAAPSGASMTPPNVLGSVASSAMDTMTQQKQLQVMDSTIAQNLANAALTGAKVPGANLEGGIDSTIQSLLSGIENFVQGWGKNNASPGGLNNIFQQIQSGAGVSGGNPDPSTNALYNDYEDVFGGLDHGIDTIENSWR